MSAIQFPASALLLTLAIVLSAAAPPADAPAPRVVCLRVAEGEVAGRLEALREDALVLTDGGERREHDLHAFREVLFPDVLPSPVTPGFKAWTTDGGVLLAHELTGGEGVVQLQGYGWRAEGLALQDVRAIATRRFLLSPSDAEVARLAATRSDPPVGEDRLMLISEGRPVVGCVVEDLSRAGVQVVGEREPIPWRDVGWMVLAATVPADHPPSAGHELQLASGSRIPADSLRLRGRELTARAGATVYSIELERVRRIRLAPVLYRYLSDMEPLQIESEPILDVVWPPRFDSALDGGELALDGRAYPKGIAMYPRTRATFPVPEGTARFLATVGVDDAAGRRGSVVFRVLVDGEEVFATEALSAA
ncbi:MAG: NPCBM/NEW2 domain-containing protein, partial [Candidatus Brocadiaceae bacterium]